MGKGKFVICILAASGMLVLILDGKSAITEAQEAIDLCIRTLIPSLFPYLVLSVLLTGALTGQSVKLLRPIGKLTGMPEGTEFLLAIGLLGGYPAGALNVAQAWKRGQISKSDAERLLGFCNNAGPSFLFGIIAPMFSDIKTAWILWIIHIISAIPAGLITAENASPAKSGQAATVTVTESLAHALRVMGMICGWVVLFRIMLGFLDRWFLWLLPMEFQVLISGILELSNGCIQLSAVENEGLRLVIAAVLLSFGGICITMQTASAASGLSLKPYFWEKLLQCCFSMLLSIYAQALTPIAERWYCPPLLLALLLCVTVLLVLYLKRNKKTSSIPAICGV